jgi:hypothetical protein
VSVSLHDPCVVCATTTSEVRSAIRAFMSPRDGAWHRGMKILCRLSGTRFPILELKARAISVDQLPKRDTRFRTPRG